MELLDRHQQAVFDLLYRVRTTQREAVIKAGEMVAGAVEHGKHVYLGGICHGIDKDLIQRGGGPAFYQSYVAGKTELHCGDVLIISSVSGRTRSVVDLAYDSVQKGIRVIALTSMEYARAVAPVHPSGKKLYEFSSLVLDNCAPVAEAMLAVDGIEAKFGAASGIASDFLMWGVTAVAVEKLLQDGITPGIYKSANFPGGQEFYNEVNRHYETYGW